MKRLTIATALVAGLLAGTASSALGLTNFVTPSRNMVPPRSRVRVLRYGTSIRLGRITCTSRRTGLTCRNRAGHGFLLSKQRLLLY